MRERLVSSASSTILGTRTSRRHLDSDTKAKDDRGLFRRLVSQASRVGPGERYGYRCCHCHCRSHRRLYHHWLLLSVSSASSIPLARSKNTDGRRCTYRPPPAPPAPTPPSPSGRHPDQTHPRLRSTVPRGVAGTRRIVPVAAAPPAKRHATLRLGRQLCESYRRLSYDAYHTTPIIRRPSYRRPSYKADREPRARLRLASSATSSLPLFLSPWLVTY
jgi:hypothetical protein